VSVGRSYGKASDDAWPSYPHVYPKAVEGFSLRRVSLPKEASPRKRWQRWARANKHAGKGKESQRWRT
jgi:hypothetical protein